MTDLSGKKITYEEFRKLLRKNSHAQFNWWKPKQNHGTSGGKPPPGVRIGRDISRL